MFGKHPIADLMMAMFAAELDRLPASIPADIDLQAEYELIQQKKSRLSAREREYIVDKYERQLLKAAAK